MSVEKKKILTGALALGIGTFTAKLLGAIYRVPLTRILGGTGIGLYQMVFPVYAVLLDFAGAGAPSAPARLIASGDKTDREKRAYDYLTVSIRVFTVLGVFFSLFMFAFSKRIASWQGDENAYKAYMLLSPSVFLVCIISSFRGYFQGMMNMKPTAISQIVEQTVKLIFGLMFSYMFMSDKTNAAAGAVLGITLSEAVTALWLYAVYLRRRKKLSLLFTFDAENFFSRAGKLIATAFPVTLIGVMLPLSNVADSFIIVNVLKGYTSDATALFGLLSGVAMTIVGLPVAVCYGIATVAVPAVSGAGGEREKNANAVKTILLTLAFSVPCAVILFFFAPEIIGFLFRSLDDAEKSVAANLLKILSPAVVFLSLLQTENAVLIGKNRLYAPVLGMFAGILTKVALDLILVRNPIINIYGGAVAVIACYFVADLINLLPIFLKKRESGAVYESKPVENRQFGGS